ncbi:hypothetical protein QJS10_CPB17g00754 [Acorus calamus]|uniref:Uncharacterized protein n=1 Tax=Acorus calamus TaxID=4465 RepID=A0AAV9CXW6_ACOCL|nr:hypothetical protein QJS10_CPB17g00754 [Acorus calamus]
MAINIAVAKQWMVERACFARVTRRRQRGLTRMVSSGWSVIRRGLWRVAFFPGSLASGRTEEAPFHPGELVRWWRLLSCWKEGGRV